jgi:hypothetical protein
MSIAENLRHKRKVSLVLFLIRLKVVSWGAYADWSHDYDSRKRHPELYDTIE